MRSVTGRIMIRTPNTVSVIHRGMLTLATLGSVRTEEYQVHSVLHFSHLGEDTSAEVRMPRETVERVLEDLWSCEGDVIWELRRTLEGDAWVRTPDLEPLR